MDTNPNVTGRRGKTDSRLWLVALLGSLLLNLVLILGTSAFYLSELAITQKLPQAKWVISPEMFKVVRDNNDPLKEKGKKAQDLAQKEKEEEEEQKRPGFMRTTEEQESKERPKDPVYIGSRNTKAASERDASPDGLPNLPSTEGRKKKDDEPISLIEQRAQMGDLEHERDARPGQIGQVVMARKGTTPNQLMPPTPPGDPSPPRPPVPDTEDDSSRDPALAAQEGQKTPATDQPTAPETGLADAGKTGEDHTGDASNPRNQPTQIAQKTPADPAERPNEKESPTDKPATPNALADNKVAKSLEDLFSAESFLTLPHPLSVQAASPAESSSAAKKTGTGLAQLASAAQRPVYDPAFPDGGRPGYKGASRKTRITGQMSTRGVAAANVGSTPLGQYVGAFFRVLNRNWDMECERNRDMIVPGSLKIRFILNKNGTAGSVRLMNKQGGTRIAQQSFTFLAIEETRIPPMPETVVQEMGEDSMELIVDFFFL